MKTFHISIRVDELAMKCLERIMQRKGMNRSEAIRHCIIYTYLSHIMLVRPEKEPEKAEEILLKTILENL